METRFDNRCPVTVVVFDPQNVDGVTVLEGSAWLYYDHLRKCYLIRFGEHRIRVRFDANQGYHAECRLTINNFRRLFRSVAATEGT